MLCRCGPRLAYARRRRPARRPLASAARTRQENIRTLARSPLVVDLVVVAPVPVYRRIAYEAMEMRARGLRVAAISRHFGVDHHTVQKAIRWFQDP